MGGSSAAMIGTGRFNSWPSSMPAGLTIRGFDASELAKTGRIVKKFADQNLTLADAHGLAIMRELRIGCCWSTDRHLGLDASRWLFEWVDNGKALYHLPMGQVFGVDPVAAEGQRGGDNGAVPK